MLRKGGSWAGKVSSIFEKATKARYKGKAGLEKVGSPTAAHTCVCRACVARVRPWNFLSLHNNELLSDVLIILLGCRRDVVGSGRSGTRQEKKCSYYLSVMLRPCPRGKPRETLAVFKLLHKVSPPPQKKISESYLVKFSSFFENRTQSCA